MSELTETVIVKRVGETQQVSEKFKKREVVVETKDENYPQTLLFQGVQDMCEKLDELRAGDDITIRYNLRGREYTDKAGKVSVFNTLQIWKFDINQTASAEQSQVPVNEEDVDDLPF